MKKRYIYKSTPILDKNFPFGIREVSRDASTFMVEYPHFHNAIELHYIFSGGGKYFIENTIYHIQKNSLIVIKSNESHRYIFDPKFPRIKKLSVFFSPLILKKLSFSLKEKISFSKLPHFLIFPEKESTAIEVIFRNIVCEYKEKKKKYQEAILLNLFYLFLICQRSELQSPSKIILTEKNRKFIETIFFHLDNDFGSRINLGYLSKIARLSTFYTSFLFKKLTSVGLKEYILQKRISEAKKSLEENPQKEVIEISYDVGFNDLSCFNRAFKRITGLSPTQYRNFYIPRTKNP